MNKQKLQHGRVTRKELNYQFDVEKILTYVGDMSVTFLLRVEDNYVGTATFWNDNPDYVEIFTDCDSEKILRKYFTSFELIKI